MSITRQVFSSGLQHKIHEHHQTFNLFFLGVSFFKATVFAALSSVGLGGVVIAVDGVVTWLQPSPDGLPVFLVLFLQTHNEVSKPLQ